MKKVPVFSESKLKNFEEHKIANLSSVVGGRAYDSTWSSSSGGHGSDVVYWGPGETGDMTLDPGHDQPCLSADVVFCDDKLNPVPYNPQGTTSLTDEMGNYNVTPTKV